MGLQIRRLSSTTHKLLTASVIAFALVVQPLYGLVTGVSLTRTVGAVSAAYSTIVDLDSATWQTDRTHPTGGVSTTSFDGRNSLELRVDAPSDASSSFYQFEGVKKTIPLSTAVTADLYIDTAWPSNVRAGIWTKGQSESGAISAYPIIEYNTDAAGGWRIFDSKSPGVWRPVSVTGAVAGWNTIQFAVDANNPRFTSIYVNGEYVGASESGTETKYLDTIYLNNYNFGTDDYAVRWSNIKVGTAVLAPVTNAPNGWHLANTVTFSWNVPADTTGLTPVSYELITGNHPNVDAQGRLTSGVVTRNAAIAGTSYTTTLPNGPYQWQVRAKYADGTFGSWSSVRPLQVIGKPVVTSPADGHAYNTSTLTAVWNGSYVAGYLDRYEIRYKVDRNGSGTLADDPYEYRYDAVSAGGNTFERTQTWSNVEGLFSIEVRAKFTTALAGSLYSGWSDAITYSRDVTAPAAPVLTNSPVYVNLSEANDQAAWSHSGDDVDHYEYREYLSASERDADADGNTSSYWTQTRSATERSQTVGQSWTGEKTLYYRVVAVDAAGNRTPSVDYGTVIIDKVKPSVEGSAEPTLNPASFTITATDGYSGIQRVTGNVYKYDSATDSYTLFDSNSSTTQNPFTVNLSALSDGVYYVRYNASDKAGNIAQTKQFDFTVDTTAPGVTLDPYNGTTSTPTLTGTVDDPTAIVTVTIGSVEYTATNNGDGTWSLTVTTPLTEGSHEVAVVARDAAGNATNPPAIATLAVVSSVDTNDGDSTGNGTGGTNGGTVDQADPIDVSGLFNGTGQVTASAFGASAAPATDSSDDSGATEGSVLGAASTKDAADNVAAIEATQDGWKIFGIVWYWWLLLLAIIAGLWWLIAARRRRKDDEQDA